jgi:hypothetical protein
MADGFSDHDYGLLIAAITGIDAGKGLLDYVEGPDFGRPIRIDHALEIAAGADRIVCFAADHIEDVDRAFKRLQGDRTSNSVAICGRELFDRLRSASK